MKTRETYQPPRHARRDRTLNIASIIVIVLSVAVITYMLVRWWL